MIAYLGVFQIAAAHVPVSAGMRHLTGLVGMLLLLEPVLNPGRLGRARQFVRLLKFDPPKMASLAVTRRAATGSASDLG